jgi:hypothetical protein
LSCYKNGTNDRIPERHARNDGNIDRYSRLLDGYPPRHDRGHSRRNNVQDGCPLGKDGSQCECLAKRDSGLPRSNGGVCG